MMQKLRELLASGLVAVALLIILWWVLRHVLSLFLWVANLVVFVVVLALLFGAAHRLRRPRHPRT